MGSLTQVAEEDLFPRKKKKKNKGREEEDEEKVFEVEQSRDIRESSSDGLTRLMR